MGLQATLTASGYEASLTESSNDLVDIFKAAGAVKINLTGVAGAGTDYPVKLVVDISGPKGLSTSISTSVGSLPFHGISGSLRFYSAQGALLPMYVESLLYPFATVWVKVTDDLSTGKYIYLLDSGENNAANISDGDAVFSLFSDFSGAALDTTKWVGVGVTVSGNEASLVGADSQKTLRSVQTFGDGFEVFVNGKFPRASAGGHGHIVGFDNQYYYYNPSSDVNNSYVGKGAYLSDHVSQGSLISEAFTLGCTCGRAGGVGRVIGNNFVTNLTLNSTGVSTTPAPIVLNNVYATGQIGVVDYAFVRKWVGVTEPVFLSAEYPVPVHSHSGHTITPVNVYATGTLSAVATAGQGFGLQVNGTPGADVHGVLVNTIDTGPNKIGNMRFSRNGVPRWTIKKTDAAESGSNAGSDLEFLPVSDAGSPLANLSAIMSRDGRLSVATTPPASATAAGRAGSITWDASFIYVCTATNTWKRAAISSW